MGPEKDKERWVIKATSLLPGPAKLKYLRFLVVDAWESGSGGPLVTHLGKRPMKSDACVAVKGAFIESVYMRRDVMCCDGTCLHHAFAFSVYGLALMLTSTHELSLHDWDIGIGFIPLQM